MRIKEGVMVGVLLRNLVVGFDRKREEAYRKKKLSVIFSLQEVVGGSSSKSGVGFDRKQEEAYRTIGNIFLYGFVLVFSLWGL